ncbi:MAG: (2Fe-2S)-binding protein [Aquabacterium sp.]|mgnify:FL=1|jgi:bacterioferritin-associated ferredoxin|uniref:(2Fe-2S)-binding protein n=1 Tax=Aquabacterium sp. TaxID=1872578 RepID=UPI002A36AA8F|nr:(2Fe-2S)-binding protein [Aquabacterium sp.]MDX9842241.1 (2Fe-2S)-binding protein [Aquabacterium sp.]
MIVCVCNRISDREINRHVQQGCMSFDDLQMDTGVATCCGCCESCAREVFHEARSKTHRVDFARMVQTAMPMPA